MPRVVIEIPEGIDVEKIKLWIAEGMSKELFKKIALDALKSGIKLNLEEAIKKFEETREEAWKEIKEKYAKKGLITE